MQCSLRDMSIFIAAYEERSFTAAALREHATQSGVSQHMRNLEHILGVQLFLRERGGVTPTPAAASFYRSCLKVLSAHAQARSDISRYAQGLAGEAHVGLMPTLTSRVLSGALHRLMEEAPNVNLQIKEGYSTTLTQMVQAGELDCAIVPAALAGAGLRSHFFLRSPEVLVSRGGGRFAHLQPAALRDCGPLRLVLPNPANARRQAIEAYCATNGVEIAQIMELDSMLGTLDLVAQSDWVTVMPAVMTNGREHHWNISLTPIIDPDLPLDLMVIEPIRRPMSAHAERFINLLREEAGMRVEDWEVIARLQMPEMKMRLVAHV